jgi:lysozyme
MQTRSADFAKGIDVSHHNGTVDWPKVAASGQTFVYVKASEGTTFKDPKFVENVRGAQQAGLLVGAYHYMNADTIEAAQNEAANFAAAMISAGGASRLELPPVLDYEENPSGISKTEINKVARAFLTTIARLTGRMPMVYSGNDFAGQFASDLGRYPLWVARYSSVPPWSVNAWIRWTFWQYSQTGKVAGIQGAVDLNVYSGTWSELKAWTAAQSIGEDEVEMATLEELQNVIEAQEKRIAALEKKLNMSGKEPLPAWAEPAVIAGKAAGAIKTSADKSIPDLIALQMLYNLGLLDPNTVKAIKALSSK